MLTKVNITKLYLFTYFFLAYVVLIIEVADACRCDKLRNMVTDDIEDKKSILNANISHFKISKFSKS